MQREPEFLDGVFAIKDMVEKLDSVQERSDADRRASARAGTLPAYSNGVPLSRGTSDSRAVGRGRLAAHDARRHASLVGALEMLTSAGGRGHPEVPRAIDAQAAQAASRAGGPRHGPYSTSLAVISTSRRGARSPPQAADAAHAAAPPRTSIVGAWRPSRLDARHGSISCCGAFSGCFTISPRSRSCSIAWTADNIARKGAEVADWCSRRPSSAATSAITRSSRSGSPRPRARAALRAKHGKDLLFVTAELDRIEDKIQDSPRWRVKPGGPERAERADRRDRGEACRPPIAARRSSARHLR